MRRSSVLCVFLLTLGVIVNFSAKAQRPDLTPSHDALLIYAVGVTQTDGDIIWEAKPVRLYVKVGSRFVRLETGQPESYLLLDRGQRIALFVRDDLKTYLELPFGPFAFDRFLVTDPRLSFSKEGQSSYEGRSCIEWRATDGLPFETVGKGCVASDGTLLTAHGASGMWKGCVVLLREARYDAQSEELFRVPANYLKTDQF